MNVTCLGTVSRWEHIGRCLRKGIRKSQVPRRFIGFVEGRERDLVDIPVDKVEGTHALNLLCHGKERMVSFKTNPYVNEVVRSLGLRVYNPDLAELGDRGAGPHCLTLELERDKD